MSDVPPDRIYTDLMATQVSTLKQSYSRAAADDGLVVTFDASQQPDGLFTLTIHFAEPRPVAIAAGTPPAGGGVIPASPTVQPSINFSAGGRALSQAEFLQTLAELGGIEPELIWALIKKESETLTGFLSDRRPVILYERHVFSRQSGHRFDADYPDISGAPYASGEYGSLSQQYDRLIRAMQLDRAAALKACSWGIGQTLGEGALDLGYPSVETLVSQMIQSEGLQMQGIVAEIKKKNIADAFRTKDFDTFSRSYNGDKTGTYAGELLQDYHFFKARGLPDLTIRAAQLYLAYLGYLVHPVDGVMGDWTRQALLKFQASAGIVPASGLADAATSRELERKVFS